MRTLILAAAAALSLGTLPSTTSRVDYVGNGATTAFSFSFATSAASHVEVLLAGVKQTAGYTVTLNTNQTSSPGGTVAFASAPANGIAVRIQRTVPLTQDTDFTPVLSSNASKSVGRAVDRVVQQTQQIDRKITDLSAGALPPSTDGSSLTIGAAGSTTQRSLAARFGEVANVKDFGAKGDGTTDDTLSIDAAVYAATTTGGGTVFFPPGTYKITSALPLVSGVTYRGSSYGAANQSPIGASVIQSATSDLLTSGAAAVSGTIIEHLTLRSFAGGGHVIALTGSGAVTNLEIRNVVLTQANAAKAVVQATATNGVFGVWMHHFSYYYAASNTVPALNFANPWLSHIAIEHFYSYGSNTSAGTYSIRLEGTQAGTWGRACVVRDGIFEQPGGGAVDMRTLLFSRIEIAEVWDLSVVPANPVFRVSKSPTNNSGSKYVTLANIYSTVGTAGVPDVQINGDSTDGTNDITIYDSNVTWLDGVSTSGNKPIWVHNSIVTNTQNAIVSTVEQGGATFAAPVISTVGSGSNAYAQPQGARLSISSPSNNAYFSFDGTDATLTGAGLKLAGALNVQSGAGTVYVNSVSSGYNSGRLTLAGGLAAGSTQADVTIDTSSTRTAGALLDVRNNTVSKLKIDPNGGIIPHHVSPSISADRGDTSQTLTVGTDAQVQRWATILTQNRTITLSTTGAVAGDTFRVVRTGLGAFTIDVGGLKTIPSGTAAFVDVAYNGAAWVLVGYGTL